MIPLPLSSRLHCSPEYVESTSTCVGRQKLRNLTIYVTTVAGTVGTSLIAVVLPIASPTEYMFQ
jgi:hypothetical protein